MIRLHLRKLLPLAIILAFLQTSAQAQDKFTISGNVRDGSSGEELIGVSIVDAKAGSGTVTNVYGFYSLTLLAGKHSIVYSYIGFASDTVEFDLKKSVTFNLELKTASVDIKEVVVKAERNNENITNTDIGIVKMDIKELNDIPVLFGEKDVMKSIQLMPGISSAGEGNSGFFCTRRKYRPEFDSP